MAGAITAGAQDWLRPYKIADAPASGINEPGKTAGQALFALIDTIVSNIALANGVGIAVVKSTLSDLNGDLAHAADVVALVYADPTTDDTGFQTNNDLYVKLGASGSGSWQKMGATLSTSMLVLLADLATLLDVFLIGGGTDGIAALWTSPDGATAMQIDADGTVEITLARITQLVVTALTSPKVASQLLQLTDASGVAALTASVVDAGNVAATWEAPGGQAAMSVNADGSVDIAIANIIRLAVSALSTAAVSAKRFAVLDGGGGEAEVTEVIVADDARRDWMDGEGRSMLALDAEGGRLSQPELVRSLRVREVTNGTWSVFSRRRSVKGNHDLYSLNLTTGQVVQLTSDTGDVFDFADPQINGSYCCFNRCSGEGRTALAVPLAGGALILPRPSHCIASYGDSLTLNIDFLVANMNAAGGLQFNSQAEVSGSPRGSGGRSLSGHVRAFLGSATANPSSDSDPGETYPGNPQDVGSIIVLTDDMSPNDNGGVWDADMYMANLATFFGYIQTVEKRFIFVQPGMPGGGVGGGASYSDYIARSALIHDAYPNNYVYINDHMFTEIGTGHMRDDAEIAALVTAGAIPSAFPADSTDRDQEYVDAGFWPASCYSDPGPDPAHLVDGHPSQLKGRVIIAKLATDFMISKGWHL